jgi:hypothetical protein
MNLELPGIKVIFLILSLIRNNETKNEVEFESDEKKFILDPSKITFGF